MRKDRIEEKLLEMDREIKSLKSENRQNAEAMVTEMRKFQERIIEERATRIREVLFQGLQNLVYSKMANSSSDTFGELLVNPCPFKARVRCISTFTDLIKADVSEIISNDEKKSLVPPNRLNEVQQDFFKKQPCDRCLKIYTVERQKLIEISQKIDQYRVDLSMSKNEVYAEDLPDEYVVSNVLEPISHLLRFRVLKSLVTGGRSFKELREITGSEGGHLIYHIDKLIDAGLIVKDASMNRYLITDKGINLIASVKKLYNENNA